jgi:16S rRNA (uracil1498-N3)-methyltransferase
MLMRNIRIYSAEPLVAGGRLELPESAARHIAQVLRLNSGSELTLFDGSGLEHMGTIDSVTKSRVTVQLGAVLSSATESALRICLWHGLCRSDRMDTVVQKATELGVTEIQPVITERDVVRLDAKRAAKKLEHWRSIAISACEQSGRVRIPLVHPVATLRHCLQQFAALQNHAVTALMFDPEGEPGLRRHLLPEREIIALTGPEGGFSTAEKDAATDAGFSLVALGPRILRTETAPIVILSLVQSALGDLEN